MLWTGQAITSAAGSSISQITINNQIRSSEPIAIGIGISGQSPSRTEARRDAPRRRADLRRGGGALAEGFEALAEEEADLRRCDWEERGDG